MTPTLIITRPEPAGSAFARQVLDALGQDVPVIFSPAFKIVPLDIELPAADHVIFTSQNGVAAAVRLKLPTTAVAWCVGDRTAQAARDGGFNAKSAGGDAASLLDLIRKTGPKGRILHLSGRHSRGDISATLTGWGHDCVAKVAYDQVPQPPTSALLTAMAGNEPLVSPVFSPRSAAPLAVADRMAPLHGVAISSAVADCLTALPVDTLVTALRPNEDAMVIATCDVLLQLLDRG